MYKKNLSIFLISVMLIATTSSAYSVEDVVLDAKAQSSTTEIIYKNDIHSEFTLDDCIKIAINNNLTIESSKLDAEAQKTKIGQTWANYFPELGAGIDWNRSKSQFFRDAYSASYLPSVSANMLIFDFGKTKAYADMAKKSYESKKFDTDENINVLISNVKKSYYNLLFAQAQCAVYKDTVADFELQKKQAYTLYKAGKKAKVDVAIADYNLCKAKLNAAKAENTLKVAKLQLSRIMGFPEYSNYELASNLDKVIYSVNLEDALQNAYKVRPEFLSAQKVAEAAKMNLRASRRDFAPNVSINGSFGNAVGSMNYTSFQFGGGLTYSNFNILRTKKKVDEARISYNKSKVDLENLRQELYLRINTAYENMQTDNEVIAIAQNALEQAKEQYRQTTGRYKAGIADIIELKDGENAYLNARLDYYNSLLNYNISVADFEKEIGAPIKYFIK